MSSKITKEEIDAIVNQKNLLVRNLQITLGYYKVGRNLRKFLGSSNVNWFGFGTYASKTAGQTIRHELLPGPLKSAMIRAAGYDNTYVYLHDVLAEPENPDTQNPDSLLSEVLTQVSLHGAISTIFRRTFAARPAGRRRPGMAARIIYLLLSSAFHHRQQAKSGTDLYGQLTAGLP